MLVITNRNLIVRAVGVPGWRWWLAPVHGGALAGLLLASAWGCKTVDTQTGSAAAAVAPSPSAEPSCPRRQVVVFKAAGTALALADTPAPAAGNAPIKIEVAANDLAKAESVACKADGNCSAVLSKPVSFSFPVPARVQARVNVDFQQAQNSDGVVCMRQVKVGTTLNPTPVCMGKVLSASVDLGVQVTQHIDPVKNSSTFDAQPYCKANVSCSLPFFSVGAHADGKGIEFDATASLKGLSDNGLLKQVLPEKTVNAHLDYKDLPAPVRELRDTVLANAKIKTDNADLSWDAIADRCDNSLP